MRTILIGLDGATFTVLDDLVARGVMPNLAQLYERGARSELTSTPIPITPQAWTTMATGRGAGHHGLHDFVRFDTAPGGVFLHINNSFDNHCETVWEYASRRGKFATVLNYIATAPPRAIEGHIIPGFTSGRHLRRSSHPAGLFDRLKGIEGLDVPLLGMDLEIERQALQEMQPDQWLPWIEHHVRRERVWFSVLRHLADREPSDLTVIVLDGVDKIQHLAYRYLDPGLRPAKPDDWERGVLAACETYFRQVDEVLGWTMTEARSGARIFVASDHGFTASNEVFYVNRWLHERGYLTWRGDVELDTQGAHYTESLGNDANAIDVKHSRAYALAPSCNGVVIRVPDSEYHEFRERLTAELLAFRAPDGGQVVTHVARREECLPGPFCRNIPDLILTLRDHGFISVLNAKDVLLRRSAPIGTHHPQGVLLGFGPGLRAGAQLPSRNILDVAPLIVHSLGLPIRPEYEGRFPADFYEDAYLQQHAPATAEASDDSRLLAATAVGDDLNDEEREVILDRLKSLGYLE